MAEGVETLAHAELMRRLGCAYLQGYAFAEPMPAESLKRLLSEAGLPRLGGDAPEAAEA